MRKIKELLKLISIGSSAESKQCSTEDISSEEVVARFLFSKSGQFNTTIVKPGAFLPKFQESSDRFETSVFRKTRLGSQYPKTKTIISKERDKSIKAVALLKVLDSHEADNITIEPEESKHKWHANIIGWPSEKNERMQLAQILAAQSSLEK